MQHPVKPHKRKKGRGSEPSAPLSFRDKLQIWAWILGAFAIVLGMGHFYMTSQTARHLDQTINRWRTDYHLSSEQAERIRAIERRFHGNGSPFMFLTRSAEEVIIHHQEIAAAMNPSDGERFLKSQGLRKSHP